MGAARFQRREYDFTELFKESTAECLALGGQVVGFALFFSDKACGVSEVTVCFELFKEGVDETWAETPFELMSGLGYNLVSVCGALVEYVKYVESVKVAQ